MDPANADACVNLGRLLHEAGDVRAAESHYRAALRSERFMCLALRGPVWSLLLSEIKIYTRASLTPSVYVRQFKKWKAARRR